MSTLFFPFPRNNCQPPKFSTPAAVRAMGYCWKEHISNLKPLLRALLHQHWEDIHTAPCQPGLQACVAMCWQAWFWASGYTQKRSCPSREADFCRERRIKGCPCRWKTAEVSVSHQPPHGSRTEKLTLLLVTSPREVLHLTFGLHNTKLIIYFKRLSTEKEYVPITGYVTYP